MVTANIVLASNTQFGWIHPFSIGPASIPSQYVPLAERFFGGGGTSHRGFPDNQAGPRDLMTGFPLGGNALLFHSTELRFPFLSDNINGVFFHDMGNVYSDLGSISFRYHQRDMHRFQLHGAGRRVRRPLSHARRPDPPRPGLQLQSADFQRPEGHLSGFAVEYGDWRAAARVAIFNSSSPSGRHFDMRLVLLDTHVAVRRPRRRA